METQSKVHTLQFYTEGESFTNLIRDFVAEGSFYQAYNILKDGGFSNELIIGFFKNRLKFEGDTREGDGTLSVLPDVGMSDEEFKEMLYWAICTCLIDYKSKDDDDDFYYIKGIVRVQRRGDNKNFNALLELFTFEEIIEIYSIRALKKNGFIFNPEPNETNTIDGVIFENGDLLVCGYQEHTSIYPLLCKLGLSDSGCWTDDTKTIHISSGQISGTRAYGIRHSRTFSEDVPIEKQIQTLFKYKKGITSIYGESRTLIHRLLNFVQEQEEYGNKYNNLKFLEKFYDFSLPKFSKEHFEGACIRTSPKYSIPGLLNSKFDVKDYKKAVKEIKKDFNKFKNVKKNNELFYFSQEYIDGKNGVCHYWKRTKEFKYSVSSNRGDVVQGKTSKEYLTYEEGVKLQKIAETLSKDLGDSVQIEFVVSGVYIYIVQLRVLKDDWNSVVTNFKEEDVICKGKPFSSGTVTLDVEDILIIDSDCDSELLIGKKALVVKEDVEFSHILALSKALYIPSIYGVGEIELKGKVKIVSENDEGFILKL